MSNFILKEWKKKPYTYVFPQKKASFAYSSIEMRKSSNKTLWWIVAFITLLILAILIIISR